MVLVVVGVYDSAGARTLIREPHEFCLPPAPAVLQETGGRGTDELRSEGGCKGDVVRQLLLVGAALALFLAGVAPAPRAEEPAPGAGTSRALILVGLPGDAEHEKLFGDVARQWRDWIVGAMDCRPDDVRVLFGRSGKDGLAKEPATRKAIEREVAGIKESLKPGDRLWVFFLGHADYDGERASLHLAGPDLRGDELGKLFAGLTCREQVFWMTTPASGWFVRALSAKGRIVIAATAADAEYNETEFPQALADVMKRPPDKLTADKDGKVSVLDLYRQTVKEVEARFARDKRVPTEHAQLDDNGDGVGTEEPVVEADSGKKPTADGALAARTFLPLRTKAKE